MEDGMLLLEVDVCQIHLVFPDQCIFECPFVHDTNCDFGIFGHLFLLPMRVVSYHEATLNKQVLPPVHCSC